MMKNSEKCPRTRQKLNGPLLVNEMKMQRNQKISPFASPEMMKLINESSTPLTEKKARKGRNEQKESSVVFVMSGGGSCLPWHW
jgi:hypothetical protein